MRMPQPARWAVLAALGLSGCGTVLNLASKEPVAYGGLETAMPAFGEGLSVQERWDLVFYLFAARWPKCDREVAPMKASALALFSDFDLSAKLPYDAIGCARQHFAPP